jgi:CelD/BcsL family acetyltransferase involved in cellulose biosynthesis
MRHDLTADVDVDVVETSEGFASLREEWTALLGASAANGLFVTWEWLYTWWRHFETRPPVIVTVRRQGALLAVAPFVRKPSSLSRLKFAPSLTVLGQGDVGSDYLDIIARRGWEALAASAISDWLMTQGLVLELPRIRDNSLAMALASRLARRGWTPSVLGRDVAPYISLFGSTPESYFSTLGAEHRYNFRRRLRKLQSKFAVRFGAASTHLERRQALDVLIRLHNRRWESRGGSTAFHTPELLEFHDDFSAIALDRGWLRLFVLWLDDEPAAALYGFVYGPKFYFYQSGFDEAYRSLSVGMVAIGLAISSACDEGLDEFDLLHGAEPYKFLWARETRELSTLAAYPPRLNALIYRAGISARRQAGRFVRRWQRAAQPAAPFGPINERPSLVVPSNR